MHRNRLGCLSGTGFIAAAITVLAIAGYSYARGGLLYNPGPLNAQSGKMLGGVTSHAQIGGDCKACHTAPWESATMADRCVFCHADIASQIQSISSMHGKLMHNNPNLYCRDCHSEHRGADAQLTDWDKATFDHSQSNFPLTGAHVGLPCEQCHSSGQFSGLSRDCVGCHNDPVFHANMFGTNCAQCHTTITWFALYLGPHPSFGGEGGSGVNHGGATCRDCHTQTLHAATCTKCHEGNNLEDGGGGDH